MSAVLKIVDKQLGQTAGESFEIRLASERVTARELIQRRVKDEVAQINAKQVEFKSAHDKARSFLVRFNAAPLEARLNEPKPRKPAASLNEDDEYDAAIEGFETNQFVMLFDDRQIEDLDEELTVMPTSEVVFLRLVPLIGG